MTDFKNVIYSIERCICHVPDACRDCAYDAGHPYNECVELLLTDALSMLKAQEPRLITKDDFKKADAWGTIPAWIEYNPRMVGAEHGWAIVDVDVLNSPFKRAWTARPTDEQRKAVKWDA